VGIEWGDLQRLARAAGAHAPYAVVGPPPVLLVDLDGIAEADATASAPHGLHAVVVGTSRDPDLRPEVCDLVVTADGPEAALVAATVAAHPTAALTLVELLRCAPGTTTAAGLLAESASYGVLQAGHEFAQWTQQRAARPPRPAPVVPTDGDPVLARRVGDELRLTLHRPSRRNALDAAMRDALVEQLQLAIVDRSITRIVLDGAGPDFCSGGDLDEFGSADDASVAHLVRLERSIGRMLDEVSDRLVVRLHGAAIGSGIELAAFAATVHAAADTRIGLPEVGMGLIPGAGGTVSLTRRIGRHRTCRLALTGERIDAATALGWGLIDVMDRSTPEK
jgi:enoyl-CoA hydratase/carnithine racemase